MFASACQPFGGSIYENDDIWLNTALQRKEANQIFPVVRKFDKSLHSLTYQGFSVFQVI